VNGEFCRRYTNIASTLAHRHPLALDLRSLSQPLARLCIVESAAARNMDDLHTNLAEAIFIDAMEAHHLIPAAYRTQIDEQQHPKRIQSNKT